MTINRLENKTVLITGVSSGIGRACAYSFANLNAKLILLARNEANLNNLKKEILHKYPNCQIHPIIADVRNKTQIATEFDKLPHQFKDIDILINNAGLSLGREDVATGDNVDWDIMVDTNIKGLMYITQATLQIMYARTTGHIINIGSIAGIFPYANGASYCATKAAVHAYTRALRAECVDKNIKVSEVLPGAVNTNFSLTRFHGDQQKADNVYKGFTPLVAGDIADLIVYMAQAPAHVNIAESVIMPIAQATVDKIYRQDD